MLYRILINYMRARLLQLFLTRVLGKKAGRIIGLNKLDLLFLGHKFLKGFLFSRKAKKLKV